MAKFIYNNLQQANTMMSLFEVLLSYYLQMSYKNNYVSQFKSRLADENITAIHNLIKEFKTNLAES